MNKLLMAIVAIVVFGIIARLAIGFFSANRVATGLTTTEANTKTLSGCDGLQNCAASTATEKSNFVAAFDYTGPASTAMAQFADIIKTQSGTDIVTLQNDYLHATYKTALLGFTDDLELLLDEASSLVHVRSASRLGKSDLGANRKRIEALRELAKNI